MIKSRKKGLEFNEDALSSESKNNENGQTEENGCQDNEKYQLIYVPDDQRYFNRYTLATIILEKNFFF